MSESRPIRSEDFGPADVECPVCGAKDNHAPGLRGLCIWCACSLGHEVGTDAFEAMPRDELVRRAKAAREREIDKGTAPPIAKASGFKCDRKRAYLREYYRRKKAEAETASEKTK